MATPMNDKFFGSLTKPGPQVELICKLPGQPIGSYFITKQKNPIMYRVRNEAGVVGVVKLVNKADTSTLEDGEAVLFSNDRPVFKLLHKKVKLFADDTAESDIKRYTYETHTPTTYSVFSDREIGSTFTPKYDTIVFLGSSITLSAFGPTSSVSVANAEATTNFNTALGLTGADEIEVFCIAQDGLALDAFATPTTGLAALALAEHGTAGNVLYHIHIGGNDFIPDWEGGSDADRQAFIDDYEAVVTMFDAVIDDCIFTTMSTRFNGDANTDLEFYNAEIITAGDGSIVGYDGRPITDWTNLFTEYESIMADNIHIDATTAARKTVQDDVAARLLYLFNGDNRPDPL